MATMRRHLPRTSSTSQQPLLEGTVALPRRWGTTDRHALAHFVSTGGLTRQESVMSRQPETTEEPAGVLVFWCFLQEIMWTCHF